MNSSATNKREFPKLPNNRDFGSGPSAKNPSWSLNLLKAAPLGRSHRSKLGLSRIQGLMAKIREVLQIPLTHSIALVGGGGTGAVEFLLWNLLNKDCSVDTFSAGVFGNLWAQDIEKELRIPRVRHFTADIGKAPAWDSYQPGHDAVFVWTETTAGSTFPYPNFKGQSSLNLFKDRQGLTLCDAVAAAFCTKLPWEMLDATAFSLQKGLGGEAGLGVVVLSDRALKRCQENYTKSYDWPMPRLFRIPFSSKEIDSRFFEGHTINTISLLTVEDALQALSWIESLSQKKEGEKKEEEKKEEEKKEKAYSPLDTLIERVESNYAIVESFVQQHDWIEFLVESPDIRSHNVVCLRVQPKAVVSEQQKILQNISLILEHHKAGFDILNHKLSVPALRLWLGPCINSEDVKLLLNWIEFAFQKTSQAL